ncbi:hypothetical protein DOM22_17215 [Bdellovibrio sp. ZAP7]|uniref:hypothetical protein n=1 Tax=Bdellovibrio sp. ZAP7 TaxID=2231053 RepID=UPI00115B2448|nr:hypothetical protein [Bdellovibrio sp. ZAP7]QDK46772.1 hypothetical protein DOM22_17215 [Bdellovibrio sp. ZAP7]
MTLSDQKGFALALMVALLPIVLAAGLASYAAMTFLQIEQRFLYTCRSGGIDGQENAGKQIDALLKLNPKATRLIQKEQRALAKIAATAGTPAQAAAIIEHEAILAQQGILKIRQQQIIIQGNFALQISQQNTARKLGLLTADINGYKSLFETSARIEPKAAPKLAVSPEGADIAPTYRTDSDIERRQALVHKWQYQLRVQQHLQSFISGDYKFNKSCAVTVTEKGSSWTPKILRDKF